MLGDRRGIGPDVEEGFRVAGATHVLSVSGLHLAAVATLLFFVVRAAAARVPRLPLYVDPRAVAAAVALPAIALFALVTGEAIATLRSALMLSIGMGAYLVGRRAVGRRRPSRRRRWCCWRRSPLELADVSLQLSLASVVGIALGARGIGPGAAAARRAARGARCAWLWRFVRGDDRGHGGDRAAGGAPLRRGRAAVAARQSGAGSDRRAGGGPVGLAGAAAGALVRRSARLPLGAAGSRRGGRWRSPAAFRAHGPLWLCRTPNLFETAALTGAGCLALVAAGRARPAAGRWRGRRSRRRWSRPAASRSATSPGARARSTVTFLDIGQGDAAVIEAPGGAVMLIDGGGVRDGSFDTGARIVEPFLRARGIGADRRRRAVASSPRSPERSVPHPGTLRRRRVLVQRRRRAQPRVQAVVARRGAARRPDSRSRGHAPRQRDESSRWSVRSEPAARRTHRAPRDGLSVNDASLVLSVAFAGRRVLFPGDLEADGEGELAGRRDAGQAVAADVLKVPHHGSRTSSSPELVDAVAPELAVISLGWRNQFHFPAAEVVARTRRAARACCGPIGTARSPWRSRRRGA